ncbi:serine protease [Thelephora ganbajun]|uniref:Serine protease n=1 Tax=Thelephora ganbajun TaxID=370292 RepID=A0ACB6ZI95_THEGA|nr:serine protease [Thelephora ganbajun]
MSSPLASVKKTTDAIPGRYIVTFKDSGLINGLAGTFTDADLELLRSNPNVASIEEDGTDATWGLGRISSKTSLAGQDPDALTFAYRYNPTAGVDTGVYIIDTGILTTHPAFGGRASWGATLYVVVCRHLQDLTDLLLCSSDYEDADGDGHETHCAGTAVSDQYGVAKAANVIAVKVLSAVVRGTWSDFISGINWVADATTTSGRPSVASMSLGGFSDSLNAAVNDLVASGVTTVVAAGNKNADAANTSPASASSVVTVSVSDINDAKASFSNYGAVLATWGPGVNVISTWNDGGIKTLSGTSMATPHVSGFSAYLLSLDPTLTPSSVKATILSMALDGVLSGTPDGTVNSLVNNNLWGVLHSG